MTQQIDLPGLAIPYYRVSGVVVPHGELWTTYMPYGKVGYTTDPPPLPLTVSTRKWVYIARESPFCSLEITYKVWITDSDNIADFCAQELLKIQCTLTSAEIVDSGASIYVYKTKVVKCLGFKFSTFKIKEDPNWKEIYEFNNIRTLFGKFYMYKQQGRYYQISYLFPELSLHYDDNSKQVYNGGFVGGRREYIDASWLTLGSSYDLGELYRQTVPLTNFTSNEYFASLENCDVDCDKVLFAAQTGYNNIVPDVSSKMYQTFAYLNLGHYCSCEMRTKDDILGHSIQSASLVDLDTTWYSELWTFLVNKFKAIFKWLWNAFLSIFGFTASGLFGDGWQGKTLYALLSYVIVASMTNNVVAACAVVLLEIYKFFAFND